MKKRNRMMAMAMAAVVTATSMPTAVFAEEAPSAGGSTTTTTNNSDGSTTTKTTHDNGSSTSTTTSSNTTNTGDGSAAAPATKTTVNVTVTVRENSEGQQTHKATTTETTSSGSGTTTTEGEGGSSTTDTSAHSSQKTETDSNYSSPYSKSETNTSSTGESWSSSESSSTTVPDADNNQPGEPTGTGFANEESSDGEKFASDFQEGTTTTDTTDISGSSESETTDKTDYKGRPTEDSGSSSGQQTTTTTHTESVRFETSGEEDNDSTKTAEGTTDGQPTTEGVTQPETPDTYEQGVDSAENKDADGFVQDSTEDTGYTLPDAELEYNSSMDLTATVGPNNTEADAFVSWQGTFDKMVQAKHGEISDTAKAAAGAVSEANAAAGWVSDGAVTTTGSVESGSVTHTGSFTVTNPDGTVDHIVREVKVEKVATTDASGNTVYDIVTTTTETRTPQSYTTPNNELGKTEYFTDGTFNHKLEVDTDGNYYFMDGETKVYVENTDGSGMFTYKYGEVEETDHEPTTAVSYTLPEKPAPVNSTEPDAEGNWKEYKVVESYDEEGIQNGWTIETTIYKVDENGNRWNIGSGSETIEGTKAITTVNQKEVSKETTIDTFSQTTTVTEREVQKVVTTEVVNFGMSEFERQMTLEWLGVTEGSDAGDIVTWNSIQPDTTLHSDMTVGSESQTWNNGKDLNDQDDSLMQYIKHVLEGKYESGTDIYMYQLDDHLDENGQNAYGYCIDRNTTAMRGAYYKIENVDDQTYYKDNEDGEALRQIEAIAMNGFWGTTPGTADENGNYNLGSLEQVKKLMSEYNNGEYATEAAKLTASQALSATQLAFWAYGDSNHEATRAGIKDNTIEALYTVLMNSAKPAGETSATNILDEKDVTSATITAKEKVVVDQTTEDWIKAANTDDDTDNDVYNTNVGFTLAVVPTGKDFTVVVMSGDHKVAERNLSEVATDNNGNYSLSVALQENVTINVSIDGVQNLGHGVYLYTSNDPLGTSQNFVTVAEGSRQVELDMSLKFSVEENSDVNVDGSGSRSSYHRTDRHTNVTNRHEQDQIVTALVEVTTTTTTVTSEEWNEEFQEKWGYGDKNPEEPGEEPEEPEEPDTDIPDEDVPLSDAPEEPGIVLGEEEPMVLGEEEEPMLIAATGDSNHMTAGFGGMFAALAGMFFLRRKKEQ